MATRRVKRIKRTKKHLHHVRRKTNRRRQRHTRRQRGGMLAAFKGLGKLFVKKINPRGGSLYDGIEVFSTDDNTFHIGNQRLDEYDASHKLEDKIYADKIRFYLTNAKIQFDHGDMIALDKTIFDKFVSAFAYGKKPYDPTTFSQKSAAVDSATDTDSRKILIQEGGVSFGSIFKPWSDNSCTFDEKQRPFTKYVFTKQRTPPSVRVAFVMSSMDAKTYCALAKYQTEDSRMYDFKIDFSLISPSVTITLDAKPVESWDIRDDFEITYGKILGCYSSCEQPYTDSYEFYEEKNPVIATLFFTKKTETVYSPIVYKNHIQKLINSCVDQLQDPNINKLFTKVEATTIVTKLEAFKQKLESSSDQDLNALKQLDEYVYNYVRLTFNKFLGQKTKEQSLADQMSRLSIGSSAAAAP